MSSTFFGLQLAQRALTAQQGAIDVTGQNISNANTPGYTRQVANLTTATPYNTSFGNSTISVGSGVTLDSITRARDAFTDNQFRSATSSQQYWNEKQNNFSSVQGVLNEPSSTSLSSNMDSFWSAWSNLSNDPQDAGARSVVSEQAQELTDSFHNISQQVSQLQTGMDSAVKVQVTQINTYANQIKSLNDQITQAQVSGDNPNDLEDDRDSIVDSLSKLVNVQVVQTPNLAFPGQNVTNYKVVIGNPSSATNNVLVNGSAVYALQDPPATNASGFATVTWSDGSNVDLGTNTGTLSADITARDTDLPNFEAQMDTLANGIAQSVDAISQTGQGLQSEAMGLDFFTDGSNPATTSPPDLPTVTAATITFNPDIQADPTLIPTGAVTADGTVAAGDGTVAAAIASLANGWTGLSTQIAAGDFGTDATGVSLNPVSATSLSDLYSADVAQVGVAVQQATNMNTGAGVLLTNATNQRETVSGVSQDEEMTNLILYQKCYSAAAKMISMMDDMLDTLVNMVSTTT